MDAMVSQWTRKNHAETRSRGIIQLDSDFAVENCFLGALRAPDQTRAALEIFKQR